MWFFFHFIACINSWYVKQISMILLHGNRLMVIDFQKGWRCCFHIFFFFIYVFFYTLIIQNNAWFKNSGYLTGVQGGVGLTELSPSAFCLKNKCMLMKDSTWYGYLKEISFSLFKTSSKFKCSYLKYNYKIMQNIRQGKYEISNIHFTVCNVDR